LKKEGDIYYLKGGAYYIEHKTPLLSPTKKFRLPPGSKKVSKLFILDDRLTIYPNNFVEDATKIYVEGYWSWSEKVANMLPMNYLPD
jgi:hypothetical protein